MRSTLCFISLTETLERGLAYSTQSQAAVQSIWIGTNTEPKREMIQLLLCLCLLSRHSLLPKLYLLKNVYLL